MRPLFAAFTTLSLLFVFSSVRANPPEEIKSMNVKRITPVLLVKEIEPIIPFWVDRLGFAKTIEVPDGSKLGFITFQKGTAEVMYQTYASVEKDAPKNVSVTAGKGPTYLYMEVDNLDAVLAAMKDVKIVMPVRTAFYGMKEFSVQDPGGHFITFAQPVASLPHQGQ
ncbi:MAG TPA: VOC family protein [Candidatus Acidoferrum sp.]